MQEKMILMGWQQLQRRMKCADELYNQKGSMLMGRLGRVKELGGVGQTSCQWVQIREGLKGDIKGMMMSMGRSVRQRDD